MSASYPDYTVEEGFFSRDGDAGENSSFELVYFVFYTGNGTPSEVEAHAAVAVDTAPAVYRSKPKRASPFKRLAPNVWEVTVSYGSELDQAQPHTVDAQGEITAFNSVITFNLVGGTTHITTALDTTSYVRSGESPIQIYRAIGLDLKNGNVKGLDVFAPVLDFSRTAQIQNQFVTDAFILDLFRMTPSVNNAPFFGHAPGEILFKGARGSKRGQEKWEIGFEFAFSENATDIWIGGDSELQGGIKVATKEGWEYLEVMYKESTNSLETIGGHPMQVPAQVNVHRLFKKADFSKFKIGTT